MELNKFIHQAKSDENMIEKMTKIMNDPVLLQKLDKDKKTIKQLNTSIAIIDTILAVVGIVFMIIFFTVNESSPWLMVISFISFFALFIATGIYTKKKKKLSASSYSLQLIQEVIFSVYSSKASYQPYGGYSSKFLQELKAFPVRSLHQEDMIAGSFHDVPCRMCDVHSFHTESTGKSSTTVTDFLGTVLILKMNKAVNNELRIISRKARKNADILFEGEEFNQNYSVFSNDREEAFYIITPQMQEALLDLKRYISGNITLILRGDQLIVVASGITTNINSLKLNMGTSDNINTILNEILPMAYMIETLNLDHKFFLTEKDIKENNIADDYVSQDSTNHDDIEDIVSI